MIFGQNIIRPWDKPFKKLLDRLVEYYGGKISEPDKNKIYKGFTYPYFLGEINDIKAMIHISEFASSKGIGGMEGIDAIQYFRIRFYFKQQKDFYIRIRHESFGDKFGKKIHWTYEFQTKHKSFDEKYFLELRSERDKRLIADSNMHDMISLLEPFMVLEIKDTNFHISQEIKNEEQLEFNRFNDYIQRAHKIVKYIQDLKE